MTVPNDHDPVIQFRLSDKLTIARLEAKIDMVLGLGTIAATAFGAILGYLLVR